MSASFSPADQRRAARWAGALYLLTMATAVASEVALKRELIAPGDATRTAQNLMAHETEFRAALMLDLFTSLGVTTLIALLYIVLRPARPVAAMCGTLFRLTENALAYVPPAFGLMALWFLGDAPYLTAFGDAQRSVLTRFFLAVQASTLSVVFIPLGVGSACFAFAWLRSGYLPAAFAGFGVGASVLLAATSLAVLIAPALGTYQMMLMMPMGVFEISLGIYLLCGRARIADIAPRDRDRSLR